MPNRLIRILVMLVALVLLVACGPEGTVIVKSTKTGDNGEIIYVLIIEDDSACGVSFESEASLRAYENCGIGDRYPKCVSFGQ